MNDPEKFSCRNPASESYHDGNSAGCANCSENVPHCCACEQAFMYRTACIACEPLLVSISEVVKPEVQSSAFAKLHKARVPQASSD